jgi:segregation and condensation protein B
MREKSEKPIEADLPAAREPGAAAQPDLRRIVGALILGADHPVTVREIRRVLEGVEAERRAEAAEVSDDDLFEAAKKAAAPEGQGADSAAPSDPSAADAPEPDDLKGATGIDGAAIKAAVASLRADLAALGIGMAVAEVAGGYRLQTDAACGDWVRRMLNRGKPQRISRPMVETLAIVAYRQPISRSEIESIRGVGVGHVIKALMEMQLVRIVGRSDLPGRPFLFGTTTGFLDHFGLKSLNDLNAMQPGIERTPAAEQRAKHVKFSFKGSATDPAADAASATDPAAAPATPTPPAGPIQPGLPLA